MDDPFFDTMRKQLKSLSDYGFEIMLLDVFPFLARDIFGLKVMKIMKLVMNSFMSEFGKEFDEHMANYDPGT